MVHVPVCINCRNLYDGDKMTCKAFPEGIPDKILYKKGARHDKPVKEQTNDVVYEPIDKTLKL